MGSMTSTMSPWRREHGAKASAWASSVITAPVASGYITGARKGVAVAKDDDTGRAADEDEEECCCAVDCLWILLVVVDAGAAASGAALE